MVVHRGDHHELLFEQPHALDPVEDVRVDGRHHQVHVAVAELAE